MASLLDCGICPRKPTFTDISHLLTHIGSKAHLAVLHKLHIKSHQELAAGIQLTAYNQWFEHHGLAQLLSDRMQQKERKQAAKRAGTRPKRAVKPAVQVAELPSSPVRQTPRGKGRGRSRRAKHHTDAFETGTSGEYPLTPLRRTSWPPLQSSPPSAPPAHIDPALITTPANGNTKLKGKIWPGMAMFDAATPSEARRRNQKKDASVVKRMERLSRMVIPNEVTFSIVWSFKKSRHIDDLDDAASLIEGESPLMLKPKPKPKSRGRRKALTQVSTNASRVSKRKAKSSPSPKRGRRRDNAGPKPFIARIPSSVNATPFSDPFTPGEDEEDLKSAVGMFPPKKPRAEFVIYEDSPSVRRKASQMNALGQPHGLSAARLAYHTAPWLQPQNQNPLFLESHYVPYQSGTAQSALQGFASEKENAPPDENHNSDSDNPLIWPSPPHHHHHHQGVLGYSPTSSFEPFPGLVAAGGLHAPSSYSRNPLAEAFARFAGDYEIEPVGQGFSPAGGKAQSTQSHDISVGAAGVRMR